MAEQKGFKVGTLVIALLVVLIITTGRASRRKRAAVETKNRYLED